MPTILRFDGLRVIIWPNDHRSAYVHVIGAAGEAAFHLNCPDGPIELPETFGFRLAEVNAVADRLAANLLILCAEWSKFHGDH